MSGEVICIDSDSDEAPPQFFPRRADVVFLSECFPGVAHARLLEALSRAHGNVDAAVQCLTQVSRSPPNSPAVDLHGDVLDLAHDVPPVAPGGHLAEHGQSVSVGQRTDRVDDDDDDDDDQDDDDDDDEGDDGDGSKYKLSDGLVRVERAPVAAFGAGTSSLWASNDSYDS
jgi:hypothetical protein